MKQIMYIVKGILIILYPQTMNKIKLFIDHTQYVDQ